MRKSCKIITGEKTNGQRRVANPKKIHHFESQPERSSKSFRNPFSVPDLRSATAYQKCKYSIIASSEQSLIQIFLCNFIFSLRSCKKGSKVRFKTANFLGCSICDFQTAFARPFPVYGVRNKSSRQEFRFQNQINRELRVSVLAISQLCCHGIRSSCQGWTPILESK